jgi:hypothetical protein
MRQDAVCADMTRTRVEYTVPLPVLVDRSLKRWLMAAGRDCVKADERSLHPRLFHPRRLPIGPNWISQEYRHSAAQRSAYRRVDSALL